MTQKRVCNTQSPNLMDQFTVFVIYRYLFRGSKKIITAKLLCKVFTWKLAKLWKWTSSSVIFWSLIINSRTTKDPRFEFRVFCVDHICVCLLAWKCPIILLLKHDECFFVLTNYWVSPPHNIAFARIHRTIFGGILSKCWGKNALVSKLLCHINFTTILHNLSGLPRYLRLQQSSVRTNASSWLTFFIDFQRDDEKKDGNKTTRKTTTECC